MFDLLFGWRKASKCKKLIRRVQCRLKLLKNKRNSIVKHFREEIGQLLKISREDVALHRVEQLYKDECMMSLYELLDHFCEFIIIHLSYIRRHKDCPNDINEAVSSLIYASARCGDLPELRTIRKLFGERYGQRFALTAVELLPGNLVNDQIKEKMSMQSVPEDVKHKLVFEIFREYCLLSGPLALEYHSELHRQQSQKERHEDQIHYHDVKAIEVEAMYFDPSPTSIKSLAEECFSPKGSNDISSISSIESKVLGSSMEYIVGSPKFRQFDSLCKFDFSEEFSSEEPSFVIEEDLVYMDDVQEFRSPLRKHGDFQDQRIFIFKSPINLKTQRLRKRSLSKEKSNSPDTKKHQKMVWTENGHVRYHDTEMLGNSPVSSKGSCASADSSCLRNGTRSPYSRAMTMPQNLSKEDETTENVARTVSLPLQQVNNHVHPKLPDYDELAAKFTALKKDYLKNKVTLK